MAGEAAAMMSTIQTFQQGFALIAALSIPQSDYPQSTTIANGSSYDFVVIGGGSAGSTIAGRLSENCTTTVLLLEAGGYPRIESTYPGTFPVIPSSQCDWNLTSVNDNYTAQSVQGGMIALTSGMMLGGSSSLNHLIYSQGAPSDFYLWAAAANDSSWSYEAMLKYFKMSENVQDDKILNSEYINYHGTNGALTLTKESNIINKPLLEAYKEAGISVVEDTSGMNTGACEPLFTIANRTRQNNALAYLGPAAARPNLYLATNSYVTKLNIDSNLKVTGVQFLNSDGDTIYVKANKEVILTAGVFMSPKILMQSGIGPATLLESLDIPVVVDQKMVGKGLQDHKSSPLLITLNASNKSTTTNLYKFPVPLTTVYHDYDGDGQFADYLSYNLMFPHDSAALLQVCVNVFKYTTDVCQGIFSSAAGRNMLTSVMGICHPLSRGTVTINSQDPTALPVVSIGYSNKTDLVNMGKYLKDWHDKLMNTTYFQNVGATFLSLGLCSDYTMGSADFWQCYALATSNSLSHCTSTCAMGEVVDSKLRVKGVSNLRIGDASVIPTIPISVTGGPVTVVAEKLADLVKAEWNLS